jgi:hypothetical protein
MVSSIGKAVESFDANQKLGCMHASNPHCLRVSPGAKHNLERLEACFKLSDNGGRRPDPEINSMASRPHQIIRGGLPEHGEDGLVVRVA